FYKIVHGTHLHRLLIDRGVPLSGQKNNGFLTVHLHCFRKQVDTSLCAKSIVDKVQIELLGRQMFKGRLIAITPLDLEAAIFDAIDESTRKDKIILIVINNQDSHKL